MNRVTVETPFGTTLEYQHYEGIVYEQYRVEQLPSKDICRHLEDIRNLDIKDDDMYLATFPKSGTHWVWEILMMLRKGSATYEVQPKEYVFLDFRSKEHMANVPSPRIINAHFPVRFIPKGILEKKLKIVHVQRNPKDVIVSWYNHVRTNKRANECETFSRFLHLAIGTYGLYRFYSWTKYVKEWERFSREHPDQILNIYYEDLKEDPVREITKMNNFLQCGRGDELIKQIAEACSFQNLQNANSEVKDHTSIDGQKEGGKIMYRKGQVGDWKNWFTVSDNEKMDAWLKENLVDTELKFKYEL